MDSTAANYRSIANYDVGGCNYEGCMDSLAFNYDQSATVTGQCVAIVRGCMEVLGANFYDLANMPGNTAETQCLWPETHQTSTIISLVHAYLFLIVQLLKVLLFAAL